MGGVIVQEVAVVELRVLADLVGQSLQLSAVDHRSNCRVVQHQFDRTFHELPTRRSALPSSHGFHLSRKDSFFISSDNGVQPVKSAASGEQPSADVQASLAVAVALWKSLTELFTIPRDRSPLLTVVSEQPRLAAKYRTPSCGCCSVRFVERYCSRTRARLIFEFLVSSFEALEPGAQRPLRKGFSVEYLT
ncbi:hypothetical protein RB195_018641 [Necator americanus]|uniref:Uncharacterized protein n=1 Tax=Necator americanus TaxID=51031 RepID=A0ABR1CEC4_NECAM